MVEGVRNVLLSHVRRLVSVARAPGLESDCLSTRVVF